jgi:uncharacterized protein (TIGR00296 family)
MRPPGPNARGTLALSLEQGSHLVRLARGAIEFVVVRGKAPTPNDLPSAAGDASYLSQKRGAFVTLSRRDGSLRGCIGLPFPVKPLAEAVAQGAIGAATQDPRFSPVSAAELHELTVEVSALTQPEPIPGRAVDRPQHVRIGTDGLIVSGRGRGGLLLPQVATDFHVSPTEFLSMTCEKAGLFRDAWLDEKVEVRRFQAEIFSEIEPRGLVELSRTQR